MKHIHLHGTRSRRDLARVVLAALLTVTMTGGIGYAVASTATAEGATGDLTVQPSISKYVNKIDGGDGDQYELHLTASGDTASSSTTTATPADIVIVADKSGSMNDENRDKNSQTAVKELAGKLLTDQNKGLPENQQIRMAVVTFSTDAQLQQGFTTDAQKITWAMRQRPDGGTNWEAALAQANELSSGRQGVKKYIIFLSDGDPTFRTTSFVGACYSQDWWGRWQRQPAYSTQASCTAQGYLWQGTDPDGHDNRSGVYGNGTGDEYGFNYNAAVTEANKRGNAALYVVKTSADAKKMSDFAKDANAETGQEYDGTDAKNLTDAFNAIYTSITSTATVNVFSISDTLSKWVDPVDFAGVSSGSDIDITKYVTARNGAAPLTGYRAVYNVDSRTVTVTFNGNTGITAGKTDHIDISFRIKPSDAAYSDYATKRTYPKTGETGTGQTSAGKQGYYSNDDAQMSYCALLNVDGKTTCGQTQTIKYRHPVVQVRLGSIVITKNWSDGADKHAKDSVTVQLQRSAKGKSAEKVGDPITLNHGNNWTAQVDGLLPGYTYTVVETSNNDRYAVTYRYGQYGGDSSANGAELTKQMVWGNSGILRADITNTLETASLSKEAIKVKKVIDGRDWRDSDEFKFTLTPDEKGNPMPVECAKQNPCTVTVGNGSDHTGTFGDITYEAGTQQYHYTVTEQAGTAPAMHYSQARYNIVVSVTKTQDGTWVANVSTITKVSDDNGGTDNEDIASDQPVTFTNKYTAVASLPLTGGATARTWLLTSGSLGVLALLLLVGLAVQKRETSLV